jgi:hypothetical protein
MPINRHHSHGSISTFVATLMHRLDRGTFPRKTRIRIADWAERHSASEWCADRWIERGQRYREYIDTLNRVAEFELADDTAAVEFSLTFG